MQSTGPQGLAPELIDNLLQIRHLVMPRPDQHNQLCNLMRNLNLALYLCWIWHVVLYTSPLLGASCLLSMPTPGTGAHAQSIQQEPRFAPPSPGHSSSETLSCAVWQEQPMLPAGFRMFFSSFADMMIGLGLLRSRQVVPKHCQKEE